LTTGADAAPLRIGTRGSKLALWQANAVASQLANLGTATELVVITTTGDRSQTRPVPGDDSKRQFVKELEEALLGGAVDLCVHSAKDLPAVLPDGLTLSACLPREDPRDALVLPGAPPALEWPQAQARVGGGGRPLTIGTGSVRRAGQLRSAFPAAAFVPLRGNVDTRVRKLDDGGYDAIVLACAGLRRLGLSDRISAAIPIDQCVPAPGQGIVAIEIRAGDAGAAARLAPLHDADAGAALAAERSLVAALGGGCQMPLGAIARPSGRDLEMIAIVTSLDGTQSIRRSARGHADGAEDLALRLAESLIAAGARELLQP
jgi:hydroxymethylbilane synthase